jgi:diguanylate cyclase (GGDEF)-like protein
LQGNNVIDSPEIIRLIESASLLRDVPREFLEPLFLRANLVNLKRGDRLLSPDKLNEHVYIVISGRLSVQVAPSLSEEPIAILNPGECVGEMSVLVDGMVSAYVIAMTDCALFAIGYAPFWALIDGSNKAARNMLNILVHRIRLGNEVVADNLLHRDNYPEKSLFDSLTGLYNHHGMQEKFDRLFRRAVVGKTPLCLIELEAEGIETDRGGKTGLGGDQSLRTVAQKMLAFLRPDDHAARLIGKKFAVMLFDTSLAEATETAERLRTAIGNISSVLPDGNTLPPFTISAGVCEAMPDDSWSTLLARADTALRLAINAGGNRVATA